MPSQVVNSLFHTRTLKKAVQSFMFPADLEERQKKVTQWLEPLKKGVLDEIKEVSLHGQFLNDVFQQALGYRSVIQGGGTAWEIHAETTISDGGGSADGALGFFTATAGKKGKAKLQGRIVAPIELKGAKNDLDRPAPGRKESAVDQGWRYANYTADCKWVIVSNYREIRLYQTSKTPAYCEVFKLVDLVDLENFKQFYFLLCRQNFLPASDEPKALTRIDLLLAESSEAQESITKKLYKEYKTVRINIARFFHSQAPKDIPNRETILIEKAQKLLDRVLFIAFCEDRKLLPENTIKKAHDHKDPYSSSSIWERYKAIFRWVDQGNDDPPIPGYNGGLFKHDPILDEQLQVTDLLCTQLKELTRFDFETEISVNILGHIFEQSVTDLEELKSLATGAVYDQKKGKRKTQGVYYTPAFITQYIVDVALGGYLSRKEQALRERYELEQISNRATKQKRDAETQFWEAYRDEVLLKTRVIDPACGSGAFLIAAFDYLSREYERVNEALAALALASQTGGKVASEFVGQRSLFDLNKTILNNNLYGVDLSPESVEITKLSLWLKTAEQGKTLTYLDDNIKVGNSIVADPSVDSRAFDWQAQFSSVFADGGFDVVIGNPPYVRQELLTPVKPYLQKHYESYDGVADLYTYFYEKGVKILKPEGLLSYIVTNKWLKAGYGEGLRRFFAQNSVFEKIIDFGHAPIFEDADTFPCIVSVRKPVEATASNDIPIHHPPVWVCPVPREKLENINLPQYVYQEGYEIPWLRFSDEAWSLESPAVEDLMYKIKTTSTPLTEFLGNKPYCGIKTGLNEAFLIDGNTRNQLVKADPSCTELIKPYLRGQDIKRWNPDWQDLWMILLKSSVNHRWAWSDFRDEAEDIFSRTFSSIYLHLKPLEDALRKRQDKGRYWWELRPCVYYDLFENPKFTYQEIQFHPSYSYDANGCYTNNKVFILSGNSLYTLAVLNSPLIWWYTWRYLPHMKDEALTPKAELLEYLPIAPPNDEIRSEVEPIVSRLIEITKANQESYRDVLDWLRMEQNINKPGQKLESFAALDCDGFIQAIKARKPKEANSLSPKALKEIRDVYNDYAPNIQGRQAEALTLENRLSDLVNQAYGLTPEEIDLMWKSAPPRMPIPRPKA